MKRYIFIALVVAQLAVPSAMIASQENILKNGEQYKFKTAPVDPYDIFRGRYVALTTDQNSFEIQNAKLLRRNQDLYVVLKTDEEGYALLREFGLPFKNINKK